MKIEEIRVKNKYLSHIIFYSEDEHLKDLFERIPGHVYTDSDNLTSLCLLHVIVQKAFGEKASLGFSYDEEKVKKIFMKPEFREAQNGMVNEVIRLYKETQRYLTKLQNETNSRSPVRLYRRLSAFQQEEYFENFLDPNNVKNEVESNYLTSFHTSNSYANGIVTVECEIEKEQLIFYDNLIPLEEAQELSGFFKEGEALVRVPNGKIEYQYAHIDHQSKKLVEMENNFYY
nr:hypothetical protein [Enterococcus faecalis]